MKFGHHGGTSGRSQPQTGCVEILSGPFASGSAFGVTRCQFRLYVTTFDDTSGTKSTSETNDQDQATRDATMRECQCVIRHRDQTQTASGRSCQSRCNNEGSDLMS
ncbi:unnamed protein product [Vicia faba]|uniref:Uncharacterized protein n=1 Tax=Vicia faba TaxID=3906 RepID=A0AAV0Z5P0_VICFA|nr:unnamed protein product [Vicia faba]